MDLILILDEFANHIQFSIINNKPFSFNHTITGSSFFFKSFNTFFFFQYFNVDGLVFRKGLLMIIKIDE